MGVEVTVGRTEVKLGDGGGGRFKPVQVCFDLCMFCGEAAQTGKDRVSDAFELRQSLGLADQGVLDLGGVVFNVHKAVCEGNEIF